MASSIEEADGLAPNDKPSIWKGRLTGQDLVLVGHLPHLDKLTKLLLGEDDSQPAVTFRNGELVGLERDDSGKWAVVISPPAAAST